MPGAFAVVPLARDHRGRPAGPRRDHLRPGGPDRERPDQNAPGEVRTAGEVGKVHRAERHADEPLESEPLMARDGTYRAPERRRGEAPHAGSAQVT